jgi:hypothetical protein
MTATVATPRPERAERIGAARPTAQQRPRPVPFTAAPAPASVPTPARLVITVREAAAMHYWGPVLVAAARTLLTASRLDSARTRELVVDLSAVAPGPYCAGLVWLVELLQRALAPVRLRLVGVTPAVAAPLVGGGLGEDVEVVDTRGRTWTGRPERIRPTGTWP